MKRFNLLFFIFLALTTSNCFANVKITSTTINQNRLSTQIAFNLTEQTNVMATCNQQSNCFILYFENVEQNEIDAQVTEQLNQLKSLSFFDEIHVSNENSPTKKLSITFHTPKPLTMQLRKLKARTSYRVILDIFQKINPTPPTFRGKDTCIVLDPGHGGSATLTSNGASYYGTHEKNINLTLALLVAQKLRDEYKFTNVHLTRTEDKDVSLDERVTFAYKNNAAIFVSLHANAVENPQERQTTSGIETYFYKFQPEESSFFFLNTPSNEPFVESVNDYQKKVSESSKALATNIQASLSITTEANDRGVKDAKFFVVAQGQIIATLSEVGFLCNEEEHKKLVDPKYREKLASAICNGIISFLR